MDGHAICIFGYWSVCSNGNVGDCFKINNERGVGMDTIVYFAVVGFGLYVIWEANTWR